MGMYINFVDGKELPTKGKVQFLLDNVKGAMKLNVYRPSEFQKDLVCVLDNFMFEAAGVAYDEMEMREFINTEFSSGRLTTWLIVPNAEELSKNKS